MEYTTISFLENGTMQSITVARAVPPREVERLQEFLQNDRVAALATLRGVLVSGPPGWCASGEMEVGVPQGPEQQGQQTERSQQERQQGQMPWIQTRSGPGMRTGMSPMQTPHSRIQPPCGPPRLPAQRWNHTPSSSSSYRRSPSNYPVGNGSTCRSPDFHTRDTSHARGDWTHSDRNGARESNSHSQNGVTCSSPPPQGALIRFPPLVWFEEEQTYRPVGGW